MEPMGRLSFLLPPPNSQVRVRPGKGVSVKFYLALTILLFLAIPAWATTFENVAWLGCYDGNTCTFTLPGALTLDDSRENSGGSPGARPQVTEGQPDRGRRATGLARHVHNPPIA